MNIKTISVSYERKFNMGNYQSATIGFTVWADLELDYDGGPVEAGKKLREFCREQVKEESARLNLNGAAKHAATHLATQTP